MNEDDFARVYFPPSYAEFGLQPLEAMPCSAPVVTSKPAALSEVEGEAAMLIDLDNRAAFCHTLRGVLSDQGLRLEMRQRSLDCAARYSWERPATIDCSWP